MSDTNNETHTQTLAAFIAATVGALKRFESEAANESQRSWAAKKRERLHYIESNLLPSGSGIDKGTTIHTAASSEGKLVLQTGYHHLDSNGSYDGWTEHTITVTPAFDGLNIRVSGSNRNDIKDYLDDVFRDCLMQTDVRDDARGRYAAPWYWRTEDAAKAEGQS